MGDAPPQLSSRGARLLEAHCRSLDPDAPNATERLYAAVGCDLGRRLLAALSRGRAGPSRAYGTAEQLAVGLTSSEPRTSGLATVTTHDRPDG